jgi:uncharacterized C2H2 Zn-finger protein
MKITIAVLLIGSGAAAFALQEREGPVPDGERTRFLFHAIYEGLIEDGAQPAAVKAILDKRDEWFVPKCPICDSVFSAFRAYFVYSDNHGWKTGRDDGMPDWYGRGWSVETLANLKHAEIKRRHGAFQALVEKYVDRRFETVRMTAERKDRMKEALKIGMKQGLESLKATGSEDHFPASCPSCEGAN